MGCIAIGLVAMSWFTAKNGHNVLYGYDKQLIIGFEINRNGVFRMEKHFVILA